MKPGDSLVDKIQRGLEDSSYLLVVLSEKYVESEWCKKEQNAGLVMEIKTNYERRDFSESNYAYY